MPTSCRAKLALCLLLQVALIGTPLAKNVSSSSQRTVPGRQQEFTMVAYLNSSALYKEALRVLEVDGCQAAVQKASSGKASFLLEPLLCWRPDMARLLCPGFDYVRARHFLRVPVLLADPALPDKAKRLLQSLFPTSLAFMNVGAIQFRLATTQPGVEIELENRLGAVDGRVYLLLRVYCTSLDHCTEMRRGLAAQPSLLFEKLRLSLNSSEYAGLRQAVRPVSAAGAFECQGERPEETAAASDGNGGSLSLDATADNRTRVVEVDQQLYFLVQQRASGRVSFQRPWQDYEDGFGDPGDDYWMGLRLLHSLTYKASRVLRVELIRHRSATFDKDLFHAEYTNVRVGPAPAYTMSYSAFNKSTSTVALDALAESRGRAFSTLDRDNDRWDQSCSRVRGGSGGWWFNSCGKTNPNGVFFGSAARNESGIRWEHLDSRALSGNATLKYIRILLSI